MKLIISIIFLIIFTSLEVVSQSDEIFEQIIGSSDEFSESLSESDIIDYYNNYRIDLKNCNSAILTDLPFIDKKLALRIIDLVQLAGISDFDKLSDSLGLTDNQLYILKSCTLFGSKEEIRFDNAKDFFFRSRSSGWFQKVKGESNGVFLGSPFANYSRLNYKDDNLSSGLLIDKDAGERSLSDFYSGYLNYTDSDLNLIAGDFTVQSGLGTILWSNFGLKKGSEVNYPVLKTGNGIKPYRSSVEAGFFRGLAGVYYLRTGSLDISASAWYSDLKRSARVDSSGTFAGSVDYSGYFRTESELEKKNTIREQLSGFIFESNFNSFSAGVTGYCIRYGLPVMSESKRSFEGKEGFPLSAYAGFDNDNISLGGEYSLDPARNKALKAGFRFNEKDYKLSVLYRDYDNDFRSPFGYNFGENSFVSNETGLYFGLMFRPLKKMTINLYFDLFSTKIPPLYAKVPVKGMEAFCETKYKLEKSSFTFRIKYEDKTDNFSGSDISIPVQRKIYNFRAELRHPLSEVLTVRVRYESKFVCFGDYNDEKGAAGMVDLSWIPSDILKNTLRITYFSCDSYYSGIWQFEYFLPGYLTSKPLYGQGLRLIIFSRIKLIEDMDISIKYSGTVKNNVDKLGSGYYEIDGNRADKLIVQLDFKY